MANIRIDNLSELDFMGNELFEDSESFLSELTDVELTMNQGGSSPACAAAIASSEGCVMVTIAIIHAVL